MFATLLVIAAIGVVLYLARRPARAPPARRPALTHAGPHDRPKEPTACPHPRGLPRLLAAVASSRPRPAVAASAGARPSAARLAAAPSATPLTVGLGYIPSVQFAQFYLADQAGYYRDAGLDVTFQNQIDPELITLIGQGAVDIGMGDGTSVIPARSQGIPVRYAATIYARFPAVVFAKAASGIRTPADLGRSLGTPGRFGTGLDHAPGAARVRRPDPGRPDDLSSRTSARASRS